MTFEELEDQVEQDRDEIVRLRDKVIAELRREVSELRSDIYALAVVERYHSSSLSAAVNAPPQVLPINDLNTYNAAMNRLNERFSRLPE
jgi:hypothetical protein